MKNMDEALAWLYSNKSKVKDIQLKRISFILNDLGLMPKYRTILVAGTNGKGSTCNFLSSILVNKGYRVGLFTSPYIVCFNERIKINNENIEDIRILKYLSFLKDYSENVYKDTIPFFELCLIMSLMYFKENNIDIGIFECGIGGRHDATNALSPDLSIITSIGYDHCDRLGYSLDEILYEKMGIGRKNKPLILSIDSMDLSRYINEGINIDNIYNDVKSISSKNKTSFTYRNESFIVSSRGEFQAYNASLAIEAARLIDKNINNTMINSALDIKLPGRFDVISKDPLIIIDGAHNISAIDSLIKNIRPYNKKIITIYSSLKDKDYKGMLNRLDRVSSKFIFTYLEDSRAVDPFIFKNSVTSDSIIYNSIDDIIDNLKINSDEMVVVCGSIHFISKFLYLFKMHNLK